MKRIICGILVLCMLFSMMPMSALAEEIPEETAVETVIETVAEEASEEAVSEETVPEEVVAEQTVSEGTVPDEPIPEETVPTETDCEEGIPEEIENAVGRIPKSAVPTEPNGVLIQDKKAGTMIHEMPRYKFTAPSEGKVILSLGTTSEHHILELTDEDGFLMAPIVKERKEYSGAYTYGWEQEYFLPAGIYYARIVPDINLDGYASYWLDFTLYHECGYTYKVVDPTCTEEGVTIFTCAYCGYWYTSNPIAPLDHDDEALARIEPTCTTLGKEAGTRCTRCGVITSGREDIPMLPHTEATIPYVAPTCTEKGKTAGVECAVCKGILIAQEDIPVLPHTRIAVPGTAATCTSSGKANVTKCTVCEKEVSSTTIPKLGHDIEGYFCKRCGVADSAQVKKHGTCGDNLSWVLTQNNQLIISGSGDMWDNPGFSVSSCNVIIEEGVTSIGAHAFSNCAKSVSIPESVTRIGDYAFANCSSTSFKNVEIPEGVRNIGKYAFQNCYALKAVTLPNSLRTIGDGAFKDCEDLAEVTLPVGLQSIGKEAFSGCDSITKITVPDSVTSMGESAFAGCIKLGSVSLGNGLTKVAEGAFASCIKLSGVTFGDNITRIEEDAFAHCSAYCGIRLNKVSYVEKHAFVNAGTNNGQFGIDVRISKRITIESGAFAGTKVWYVWYEGTESDKWNYVHNSDSSISKATWNYSGYSVGYQMSWSYSALHLNVTGKGTISNYSSAASAPWYGHREEMEYVTIDKDITSIGSNAFNGYSNLKQIRFLGSAPSFADDTVFAGVTATVYYPAGDSSWSESVRQNYGGNLTWKASCSGSCTVVTDEAVAATCTETGLTEGSHCSVCGVVIKAQETVKTVGHTYLTQNAKLPTCTEPGLTKGSYCGFCGLVAVKQEVVPALGHTPGVDAAKEPECLTEGLSEGSHCQVCQVILKEQETIPAAGHNKVAMEEIPATCYAEGTTGGVHCDACGQVFVIPKKTPVLTHEPQTIPPVAPTCTENGATESTQCKNCGEIYQAPQPIPALGHDMISENEIPATCTEPGYQSGAHCSRCDYAEGGGVIPALGHIPGAEATCTTAQLCTVCQTELAFAKGHTETILQAVAPTCTETGLTEGKYCSVCNETLAKQEMVKALGHTEVIDPAKAATCADTGLTEGKYCSVCKETLIKQEVVQALGHDMIRRDETPATCTEPGYQAGAYCSRCDYVEAGGEIPALGHSEVIDEARAATCTKDGVTEGKHCDRCGEILIPQEIIPATGHEFEEEFCIICGAPDQADFRLFSGKSLSLKILNPETGKNFTSEQITFALDDEYEAFATLTSTGKLTAKKILEMTRIEFQVNVLSTGETLTYTADLYPALTQLEVQLGEDVVANNASVPMDFTAEPMTFRVNCYPEDTLENVEWSISDKKGQYAEYTVDGDTLTVLNPTGKAGTVTVKATVNAGNKKTVTFKLQLGSYAKTVEIEQPESTTIRGGESLKLKAAITDPESVTKSGIVWTVSDKTIATISNGTLKAKSLTYPATVTVTATSRDGQASDSIDIRILPKKEGQLVLMLDGQYVTGKTVSLNAEDLCQLEAYTILDGEIIGEDVTWSSSKATTAEVDENGLVTALASGTAKITAKAGKQSAFVNVKVTNLVSDIEVSTKDGKSLIEENGVTMVILPSGKSATLSAAIQPKGASKSVTWEIIQGGNAAKITSSGKITANKDQTRATYVLVRATAKDGSGCYGEITVKVVPLANGIQIYEGGMRVRSNTVYVSDLETNPVIRLSARVYPYQAAQEVAMTSSNKKVAYFDEFGDLICVGTGSTTITATAQDGSKQKATFKLTVVNQVTDLSLKEDLLLNRDGDLFISGGKSLKLNTMVDIYPGNATNKKLTWSVSRNDAGIKINSSGVLSTKKVKEPVTVNIMAVAQDGSGEMLSFDVTVYPATTKLTLHTDNRDVTGKVLILKENESIDLTAICKPENAAGVYSWTSSNEDYVYVDDSGTVTALQPGKVITVTCKAEDGTGKKATVKIKVS